MTCTFLFEICWHPVEQSVLFVGERYLVMTGASRRNLQMILEISFIIDIVLANTPVFFERDAVTAAVLKFCCFIILEASWQLPHGLGRFVVPTCHFPLTSGWWNKAKLNCYSHWPILHWTKSPLMLLRLQEWPQPQNNYWLKHLAQ